jgi:hypothetical protein
VEFKKSCSYDYYYSQNEKSPLIMTQFVTSMPLTRVSQTSMCILITCKLRFRFSGSGVELWILYFPGDADATDHTMRARVIQGVSCGI